MIVSTLRPDAARPTAVQGASPRLRRVREQKNRFAVFLQNRRMAAAQSTGSYNEADHEQVGTGSRSLTVCRSRGIAKKQSDDRNAIRIISPIFTNIFIFENIHLWVRIRKIFDFFVIFIKMGLFAAQVKYRG